MRDDKRQYYALDDIAYGIGYHGISEAQIKKDKELTAKYFEKRRKREALEKEKARKQKAK